METQVYSRRKRRQVAEINVVPYIDVMLVLLVIFMITAPLLRSGVDIDLPDSDAEAIEQESDEEPLILSVDSRGDLYLNISESPSEPISEDEALHLIAALLREHPNKSTLVEGDAETAYSKVMDAMVILQAAGAKKVQLLTEGQN